MDATDTQQKQVREVLGTAHGDRKGNKPPELLASGALRPIDEVLAEQKIRKEHNDQGKEVGQLLWKAKQLVGANGDA